MTKIKLVILMFTAFIIGACATNYEEEKSVLMAKPESTDLVSSFEAEKEQAQIFQGEVVKESPKKEVTTPEKKPKSKTITPAKKTEPTKKEGAPVAPTPEVAPPVEVTPAPTAFMIPNNPPPADYPEDFKAYDTKARGLWEKFKPIFHPGEQSIMAVTYLGVTAGHITIQSKEITTLNGKPVYHFYARFKSSDSYRYFYWLDDTR